MNEFWPKDVSLARFLLTGTVLEFVGNACLYPIYHCKVHLQTNTHPLSGHGNPFVHLLKQAQHITAESGIKGLYRGYLCSTIGSFPGIMAHIAIYTICKYQFSYNEINSAHEIFSHSQNEQETEPTNNKKSSIPQPLIPFVSSVVAESVAVLFYVPQEVIVQRLQLSPKEVKLKEVVQSIYNENGIRSFWRGTVAAYSSYLPSSAMWWATYELYKNILCKNKEHQNLFGYSVAGIFGGITTALCTNPIDVVRARIQTQKGTYGATKIVPVIMNVYSNEGLRGFTKAIGARVSLFIIEGLLFADFYEIIMYFSHISPVNN